MKGRIMKRKIILLAMLTIFVFSSMAFTLNDSPLTFEDNEISYDNGSCYIINDTADLNGSFCCPPCCNLTDFYQ